MITVVTIAALTLKLVGFPIYFAGGLLALMCILWIISEKIIFPRFPELRVAFFALWIALVLMLLGLYEAGILPITTFGYPVEARYLLFLSIVEIGIIAAIIAAIVILTYALFKYKPLKKK